MKFKPSSKVFHIPPKQSHELMFLPPTFKEKLTPIFLKSFCKVETERTLSYSFYVVRVTLIHKPQQDSTMKKNFKPISFMNIDAKTIPEND